MNSPVISPMTSQPQTTHQPSIGSIVIPNIKFSGGAHATDDEYMWDGTMDFNHQQVDLYQRITRQHQASYQQAILQASSHFTPLAQRYLNAMILSCKIRNFQTPQDIDVLWREATHEVLIPILQEIFKTEEVDEAEKIKQSIGHACATVE